MAFDPLSIFTGSAYDNAANQQRSYLTGLGNLQTQQIQAATDKGLGALQAGQAGALGAIAPAISTARTDISGGIDPAIAALYGGQNMASGALTGSVDPAIAALSSGVSGAAGAYSPVLTAANQYGAAGGQASDASADALGLNGPEGVARAQQQFQTGPGFNFALNTGLESILRNINAAGGGNAVGGNLARASQTYGQGLGQQEWNNWLTNLKSREALYNPLALQGYSTAAGGEANAALTGGTGAANIYTGTGGRLADLYSTTGRSAAPVYTGSAQSLADLAKTGGLASANVYTGVGGQSADLIKALTGAQVGAETSLAGPYASTYGAQAAADTAGAGNLWGLGLQGLKMAGGAGFLPSGGFTPWAQPKA